MGKSGQRLPKHDIIVETLRPSGSEPSIELGRASMGAEILKDEVLREQMQTLKL